MSESAAKPAAATDSPKKGMLVKLIALVFLLVVLGGEALIAFLFLPTADEVAAAGHSAANGKAAQHKSGHDELPGLEHEVAEHSLKELDLEKYNLTIPNMKTGTS